MGFNSVFKGLKATCFRLFSIPTFIPTLLLLAQSFKFYTIEGKKLKVKCTLVQELRLCTGRTVHRGSRVLLFLDHGSRRGWGVSITPRTFFTPGKNRYPFYRRLGGPQGRSGQVQNILPSPGFDPRTVQPVASRDTDYATRPTHNRRHVKYVQNLLSNLRRLRLVAMRIIDVRIWLPSNNGCSLIIVISQLTHMTRNSKVMPKQTMSYDRRDVSEYLTPYSTAQCWLSLST